MYNSHTANGWCNNHNHKYFAENQIISKTVTFITSPQAIIYQLSNHHSQQYINYHCKNNLLYCSLCLCINVICFLHKAIVHNLISFQFQTKDSDAHVYVHQWSQNNGTETSKATKFCSRFLCWLTIPFINIMFFY